MTAPSLVRKSLRLAWSDCGYRPQQQWFVGYWRCDASRFAFLGRILAICARDELTTAVAVYWLARDRNERRRTWTTTGKSTWPISRNSLGDASVKFGRCVHHPNQANSSAWLQMGSVCSCVVAGLRAARLGQKRLHRSCGSLPTRVFAARLMATASAPRCALSASTPCPTAPLCHLCHLVPGAQLCGRWGSSQAQTPISCDKPTICDCRM